MLAERDRNGMMTQIFERACNLWSRRAQHELRLNR